MSFGYSVGDVIVVSTLAWKVYKSCRDAPESYSNISDEVSSLYTVLKEVEEVLTDHPLLQSKQNSLSNITSGCQHILQDLEALVKRYESLGSNTRRTWDRMKWMSNDIAELRQRLTSNTMMLTAFLSALPFIVEKKLNKLVQEYQEGKHEGSILTVATVESLTLNEKEIWRAIRKDFDNIGISVAAFDANKDFIMDWFQNAIATGAFEEKDQDGDTDSLEGDRSSPSKYMRSISSFQRVSTVGETAAHEAGLDALVLGELNSPPDAPEDPRSIRSQNASLYMREDSTRVKKDAPANSVLKERKKTPRLVSMFTRVIGLNSNSSFFKACERGDLTAAKRLLDSGADIDAQHDKYETALTHASKNGNEKVVRWLLQEGADKEGKHDLVGPLWWASLRGHASVVRALLEAGVALNQHPLSLAARSGNLETVTLLVENGADVNEKSDTKDGPPLVDAIRKSVVEIAKYLVDHGADVNITTSDGQSVLTLAMETGNFDIAMYLLHHGADVQQNEKLLDSVVDDDLDFAKVLMEHGFKFDVQAGKTRKLFCLAVSNDRFDIVKCLLLGGVDVNTKLPGTKRTALIEASSEGQFENVKLLVERYADVNAQDFSNDTALKLASERGHTDIVKTLLNVGADVELRGDDNWTALMLASREGHLDIVEALIDSGADVDAQDSAGDTALTLASGGGHADIVRALIKDSVNVDMRTNDSWTALMIASTEGHVDVVGALLEGGASVNAKSGYHGTALTYASKGGQSKKGHPGVVRALIEGGADIEEEDTDGLTALVLASNIGDLDSVKMLIERGANVQPKALMYAVRKGYQEIVRVLLEAGVDMETRDPIGRTALIVAVEEGHLDVLKTLIKGGANMNVVDDSDRTAAKLAREKGDLKIVRALDEAAAASRKKRTKA